MLQLSRRVHESIRVGTEITITINKVRGRKVVIGIDAPREIPIHRNEVFNMIIAKELTETSTGNAEMIGFSRPKAVLARIKDYLRAVKSYINVKSKI